MGDFATASQATSQSQGVSAFWRGGPLFDAGRRGNVRRAWWVDACFFDGAINQTATAGLELVQLPDADSEQLIRSLVDAVLERLIQACAFVGYIVNVANLRLHADRELMARIPRQTEALRVIGDEGLMSQCEEKEQKYLFKLRQSPRVKDLIKLMEKQRGWEEAGQGFEGVESRLRLKAWSAERRVVVLRRLVKEGELGDGLEKAQGGRRIGQDRERLKFSIYITWNQGLDNLIPFPYAAKTKGRSGSIVKFERRMVPRASGSYRFLFIAGRSVITSEAGFPALYSSAMIFIAGSICLKNFT